MKRTCLTFLLSLGLISQVVVGQIPGTISYQGILKNSDGTLVSDGTYSITVSLYDVETAGTSLWSETHSAVSVTDGIFNVILGSVTALSLDFDKQYWLGVTVGTDSEMSPRIKLTSSPYSLNSLSVLGTANVFPSSGNVGIGTTSPADKLDVAGTAQMTGFKLTTSPVNGYVLTSDASGVGTWQAGLTDHGGLSGLADDDHSQYALLDGRTGGQTLSGGTAASGTLTLESTSNATKGKINFGTSSAYDEANTRLGIGTVTPTTTLDVSGTFGVSGATTLGGVAYTWPSADGSGGQLLSTNGTGTLSWSTVSASPAGSDGQVQYNNGGSFGGAGSLYFDDTNSRVGIGTTSPTSTFEISGSFATSAVTTTIGSYTISASDYLILVNNTTTTSVTLPTAVGIKGRRYIIKRIGATAAMYVNVYPSGTETIDGGASTSVNEQWNWVEIISDGSNWLVIGKG
ncbi:MAG: hypothetical protein ACE5HZ_03710 [Fidelibacterota bacterium]